MVKTPASSGAAWAALMTPRATATISSGGAPVRLWTSNSKPEELPSPAIGGGLKA